MKYRELAQLSFRNSIVIITIKRYSECEDIGDRKLLDHRLLDIWKDTPGLKGMAFIHQAGEDDESEEYNREIINWILRSPIPTVSVLTGRCTSSVVYHALACHIRVCSRDAVLVMPPSDDSCIQIWHQFSGMQGDKATQNFLKSKVSSQSLTASEAYDIGVVDHLVSEEEALPYAMNLLDSLTASRPVHVIRAITQALNNARLLSSEVALDEEGKLFCQLALRRM